jgi:hypothetical protein
MCWMMSSQRVEAGPLYTIFLPILPPSLPYCYITLSVLDTKSSISSLGERALPPSQFASRSITRKIHYTWKEASRSSGLPLL